MSLSRDAAAGFEQVFGRAPEHIAVAPGRVNLIGDHTDYTGGLALPFAIDRGIAAAASHAVGGASRISLVSGGGDSSVEIALDAATIERRGDWSDYPRGVADGYRRFGIAVPGLDIFIASDLPQGAGLSSSAALETAVARVIEAAAGIEHEPRRMIEICHRAEHDFAGTPCGYLDQFAVVLARAGHCLRFDAGAQAAEPVPFAVGDCELLVLDSGVRHRLSDGGYAERRRQAEAAEARLSPALRSATAAQVDQAVDDAVLRRRARHIVTENARVEQMIDTLAAHNSRRAGQLMFESHASLRDDYEVSVPEIDTLVAACQSLSATVFGARMTGGGFGGSVIALIRRGCAESVLTEVAAVCGKRFSALTVQPSAGVRLI